MAAPAASTRPGKDTRFQFGPDAVILSRLVADGRASFEELAAGLGVSRQSAWRRVQALEGSVVWGIGAVVDHRKIGWRQYIITIQGSPDADTLARVEATETLTESWGTFRILTTHLVRGTGGWRLMLTVAVQNSLVLEAFLQALAERFPGQAAPAVDEVEHVIREGGFSNPSREALAALPARRSTR